MELTVSQAVDAFDIHPRRLQRLLAAGKIAGAHKDDTGRWHIPITGLHEARIPARKTWLEDSATAAASVATNPATHDTTVATLRDRIRDLETQLDTERRLKQAAEQNATDLRNALRILEPMQLTAPPRKPWWRR